jgi:hypothetical protein
MSGLVAGWAFRVDVGLSPTEKYILVAMADNAHDDGLCWPRPHRTALKTGLDRSTVYKALSRFRDLGLMTDTITEEGHPAYQLAVPDNFGSVNDSPTENETASHSPSATQNSPRETSLIRETSFETSKRTAIEIGRSTDDGPDVSDEPSEKSAESDAVSGLGGRGQLGLDVGDDDVAVLWDYYVSVFRPSRSRLTPSRARAIRKGFKEEFTLDDLRLAVLGLFLWRRDKPGDRSISSIFTTYPGGQTLADRISFFIQVAESSGPGGSVTSVDPVIVQQKQQDVQRGHQSGAPDAVEKAKEAESWLQQHGIETIRGNDGYPTFQARGQ